MAGTFENGVAAASRFDGLTAQSGSASLTTLSLPNRLIEGQPQNLPRAIGWKPIPRKH